MLIGVDGKPTGVMAPQEALRYAEEEGLEKNARDASPGAGKRPAGARVRRKPRPSLAPHRLLFTLP